MDRKDTPLIDSLSATMEKTIFSMYIVTASTIAQFQCTGLQAKSNKDSGIQLIVHPMPRLSTTIPKESRTR